MDVHDIAVDVRENGINSFNKDILKILLVDRTTKKNIIWATGDYENYGESYQAECPITIDLITGDNSYIIQPRITKAKSKQTHRTKSKAEVFTPAWICNEQNNLIDSSWFGRSGVFNFSKNKGWQTNEAKIQFEDKRGRRWMDYADAKRLEITCGEATYLTSRYDMLTGDLIDVRDRIGLLDRKLRVVNENTDTEDEWLKWAYRSYESIYGFEFQGDSLLLARENLQDLCIAWQKQAMMPLQKPIALCLHKILMRNGQIANYMQNIICRKKKSLILKTVSKRWNHKVF